MGLFLQIRQQLQHNTLTLLKYVVKEDMMHYFLPKPQMVRSILDEQLWKPFETQNCSAKKTSKVRSFLFCPRVQEICYYCLSLEVSYQA